MITEFGDFAVVGMGAFALGAFLGRRLAMEASKAFNALESRMTALEHRGTSVESSGNAAPHAAAMAKLASAIEKHAAAIDDHGAATVAAAVESNAKPAASTETKPN